MQARELHKLAINAGLRTQLRPARKGHMYVHWPCFDGASSAAITADFLEKNKIWKKTEFHEANYHLKEDWKNIRLQRPCAIPDFLYHSRAGLWMDHHEDPFVSVYFRQRYRKVINPFHYLDEEAPSCAGLAWRYFHEVFGYQNPHFEELAHWADIIDHARFSKVEEAVFGGAPALTISLGIMMDSGDGYCERLIRYLMTLSLEQVARIPEVEQRFNRVQGLTPLGLERFRSHAILNDDGIVVCDLDDSDTAVPRFAAFYLFPEARYSAEIRRSPGQAKVRINMNTWLDFESVNLAEIVQRILPGGGGHGGIGTITLYGDDVALASEKLAAVIAEIRKEERVQLP
jgi:hypothetical protein